MDSIEVLDNGTFLVSTNSSLFIRLSVSNTLSGDDRTTLMELNNQSDVVDFFHDEIVFTAGNYTFNSSSGCSEQMLDELRQEFTASLDNYLLKQIFYDYIENRSLLEEYIKYIEERDFLLTEKTFVTRRGFVMYLDDDTYSEGGGDSSGGSLNHNELINRDAANQHPIDSITGLREIVDRIEDGDFSAQTDISWDDIEDKPDVYHTENANLFTVDWKAKDFLASGQVVMFTTSALEGGDAGGGSSGTYFHDELQNLDVANQHPISAIIGLSASLDSAAQSAIWSSVSGVPSWINSFNPNSKLNVAGGTITGDLRLKGSGNYGNKLSFGDGDYVYLYEYDDDCLEIKASTLNLIGSVKIDGEELGFLTYFNNSDDDKIKITIGDITKSFEVDYSARAGMLATSRTLWGVSFDGTENISGDLIDVGSIDMSGKLDISNSSSDSIKTHGGVVMFAS